MRRLSAGIAAVVSSQLGVRNCATSASASAASSSGVVGSDGLEDPRRRRYVDALRTVIRAAPPSGSKVHDIASNLEILLCQDADPTKFGFTKLSQALSFLQDEYYIINRDTLVHCDWPSVLRKVRMTIPTEGVMLPAFVRHIAHLSPGFEDSSIPGCTLEQWIASKWGHLFTMIAHPTTRAFTVFRRVDVERSKKVRQVERALTLIGRHPDLPVFTDVQAIAPLLPHRGNHQTWPSQLMTKGDLVDAFDLDVDLLLRLPRPPSFSVFVDGSSVSPIEVRRAIMNCENSALTAAFDSASALAGSSSQSSTDSTEDEDTDAEYQLTALRHRHNAVHHAATCDIVVDGFMRVEDELVASIATCVAKGGEGGQRHGKTFVVIVGDAAADRTSELLRDSLPDSVLCSIMMCTPIRKVGLPSLAS